MIALGTGLELIQEARGGSAADKLKTMISVSATVRRDGTTQDKTGTRQARPDGRPRGAATDGPTRGTSNSPRFMAGLGPLVPGHGFCIA